jgi:hypothetical protein
MPALSGPGVPTDDPTAIDVLVVTTDDVVAALEANERREEPVVLRVTPPFSGRMRARIHVEGSEGDYGEPSPLHVSPGQCVGSIPPFPAPDETEDRIRSDPDATYSPERHRRRHEAAVERWRAAVREAILTRLTLDTPAGSCSVRLSRLG